MNSFKKQVDVYLVTVPFILCAPSHAAGQISASIKGAGFTCQYLDWNYLLWQKLGYKTKNEEFCYEKFVENRLLFEEKWPSIKSFIEKLVDEVGKYNPKWLALSVQCTSKCMHILKKILEIVKEKYPKIKIIVGGNGISIPGQIENFAEKLLQQELIDYLVIGEGEKAIVELLNDNTQTNGINLNPPKRIKDLDQLNFPDYSDISINEYLNNYIPISGSRGCVHNCKFCSKALEVGYYTKSGKRIVKEMIHLSKQTDNRKFYFTDCYFGAKSTILNDFLFELEDAIAKGLMQKPQYITNLFFSKKQIPSKLFEKLIITGCKAFVAGIETGSENLRFEMGKKVRDSEINYIIENCVRVGLPMSFNLIIGYPTESEKDVENTLDFFEKYSLLNKLIEISLNVAIYELFPGSFIYTNMDEYSLSIDQNGHWVSKITGSNIDSRTILKDRVENKLKDLGYIVRSKQT